MTGMLRIDRSPAISGRATVPGSKSLTNRALAAAALATGTSRISGGLAGDDADSMVSALRALGASITAQEGEATSWRVEGSGGHLSGGPVTLDAGLAGTALRILTAIAVIGEGGITVTGAPGLLRRPVGPLLEALRTCGADVSGSGNSGRFPPVRVGRRLRRLGGSASVDATQSSQFVTALLMAAPYFDEPLELEVSGLKATGFVELTCELMGHFGVEVEVAPGIGPGQPASPDSPASPDKPDSPASPDNPARPDKPDERDKSDERDGSASTSYLVPSGGGYDPADYTVPPDASAASHLFTLALATGGEVTVESLASSLSQPDAGVLAVFEAFGATVVSGSAGDVSVRSTEAGPDEPTPLLRPVEVDLSGMPDQLPNVAVLAALAPGTSRITGVGITRQHETDRMDAVAEELGKVGIATELEDDAVAIHGGTGRGGATLSAHGDHRMAMALAALAGALGECRLEGAGAVSKTYRHFWRDAERLGLRVWRG